MTFPGRQVLEGTYECNFSGPFIFNRSYELVATACKDKRVRIFKLTMDGEERIKSELVADLKEHHAEVWRVEWNITGTTLASSGDDGRLLLWRGKSSGFIKVYSSS